MAYGYTNQSKTWYFKDKSEAIEFGLSESGYNESTEVGYNQEKKMWFVTID